MHSFGHNPQIFTFIFGSFEISIVFAETCRIMIKHVKSAAFWRPRHFSTEPDLTGGMVGFGNPNFENAPPRKDDDSVGKPKDFWEACLNQKQERRTFVGPQDLDDVWVSCMFKFVFSIQYDYLWVWDSQICTPTFCQHSLKHSSRKQRSSTRLCPAQCLLFLTCNPRFLGEKLGYLGIS